MIFEQSYGNWIKSELNTRLHAINADLQIKKYDDVSYKPLYYNKTEMAMIINGGGASRSSVKGIDQNVMPMSIILLCRREYSMQLRNAVDNLQKEYNAVPMTLTFMDSVDGTTATEKVESTFSTPVVFDEKDQSSERETMKVTFMQISISIIYGQQAFISPVPWALSVDGTDYPINYIADYTLSSANSYDDYHAAGNSRIDSNILAKCNSFSFTTYKREEDALQKLLEADLYVDNGGITDALVLKLIANYGTEDAVEIKIKKVINITESYTNKQGAFSFTLGR